jgi:hypothetical protein
LHLFSGLRAGALRLSSGVAPMAHPSCTRSLLAAWCVVALTLTGCPKPGAAAKELTQAPDLAESTGQAKCGVQRSSAKPLVVEWPAADRAALESRANRGLVAVRYEGCEMEVLTTCAAQGSYAYHGLTHKREAVRIRSADELYAQLPVGAVALEAKLERAGQLNVDMMIVGRKEADRSKFTERDLDGRCDGATHVITGLTVGAFSFYTGASAEVGAGVRVGQLAAGAASAHGQEILSQDGDGAACIIAPDPIEGASESGLDGGFGEPTVAGPPNGCGALLRVEVVPIERIFGTSRPTHATSGGAPSSAADVAPQADPQLDRKIRNWKILTATSYVLAIAGVGGIYGGIALFTQGKNAAGQAEPGPRQEGFRRIRAGQGLLWGSVGAMVGFGVLAIFANKKVADLNQRKRLSLVPAAGADGGGLRLTGRF